MNPYFVTEVIEPLATETSAPSSGRPAPESRAKILFVDDDAQIRSFCKLILSRAGYTVETAGDGAEAWAALRESECQLLITDYQMPRINGLELVRKVRLANMPLPIIMVSSLVGCGASNDMWSECSATLAKPFTVADFVSVVRGVLQSSVSSCAPSAARELHPCAQPA